MKLLKMDMTEVAQRSAATFVAGAIASPIVSIVFDIAWWKAAAMAGVTAVVNLAGRSAQSWLTRHPEGVRPEGVSPPTH